MDKHDDRYSTQHILNRWNLRTNLDINVNKYLRVGLDLGGRIDNINQPTTGVFDLTTFSAVEANPMEPVYTPGGEIYSSTTARNPTRLLGSAGQERNRRRLLYSTAEVNGYLDPITKGLEANLVVSFDGFDVHQATQHNSINTYSYDYMNMDVQRPEDFKLSRGPPHTLSSRIQALTSVPTPGPSTSVSDSSTTAPSASTTSMQTPLSARISSV